MEFLVKEKDYIEVKLEREDLGFAQFVVSKLLEDKSVSFAATSPDHVLKGNPIIKVRAKDAKKALASAFDDAAKEISEAKKAMK